MCKIETNIAGQRATFMGRLTIIVSKYNSFCLLVIQIGSLKLV